MDTIGLLNNIAAFIIGLFVWGESSELQEILRRKKKMTRWVV